MRVLQIVADGSPGGGTTNVLALTEDLIAQGVDVTFCSQQDSYALAEAGRLGAAVQNGHDFFRSRVDSRIARQLGRTIANVNPDIVHVHGGRAAFAWVRAADAHLLPHTIYTVRGYHFYRKSAPLRLLAKRAERMISRSVFKTVHVCRNDQQVALDESLIPDASSSCVIRNGVRLSDIPRRSETDEKLEARRQVAVLGRIAYQKNPNLVLDLAKQLAEEGFVFHLIGGGELEPAIRQRIDQEEIPNVVMHGNQPRDEGLRRMASCGTFLLASRWEGLPIAPVEAMVMGLAVVISDVNGNTEVARNGIEARVAPSEDCDAFVKALRAVVSERQQTDRLIANGRKRVEEEFTRDRVVRQHLNLYRACIGDQQFRWPKSA